MMANQKNNCGRNKNEPNKTHHAEPAWLRQMAMKQAKLMIGIAIKTQLQIKGTLSKPFFP